LLNAQTPVRPRVGAAVLALLAATLALACLPNPAGWPLPVGIGGAIGDTLLAAPTTLLGKGEWVRGVIGVLAGGVGLWFLWKAVSGGAVDVGAESGDEAIEARQARPGARTVADFEADEPVRTRRPVADEFDDEDQEGRFATALGLMQHWALTARAHVARLTGLGAARQRRETFGAGFKGKLGHVLSPMDDEVEAMDRGPARRVEPAVAPRAPRFVDEDGPAAAREPRLAEPRVTRPTMPEPRRPLVEDDADEAIDADVQGDGIQSLLPTSSAS
jgi:S-DNA-T family DNA segregation ATPase FtsK/SpoIIIE